MEEKHPQSLKRQVKEFPESPGVYLMKNKEKTILYVGKARNLKNRVLSYFLREKERKTGLLMEQVRRIDFILTATEYEALLLENTLIKQWNPRYNINLKDGKTYPVIRITKEDFPRVFRTRNIIEDGSEYFGPFPDIQKTDICMDWINRALPLRKCKGKLKMRKEPCLYYHMKQCEAPCCGLVSAKDYRVHLRKVRGLLKGQTGELKKELRKEIRELSDRLEFEKAAQKRDWLESLELTGRKGQAVVDFNPRKRDYVAFAEQSPFYLFAVMKMREGKLKSKDIFEISHHGVREEVLQEFLLRYYTGEREEAERIYLEEKPSALLQKFFEEEHPCSLKLGEALSPREKTVIKMAKENARAEFFKSLRAKGDLQGLEELKRVLELSERPCHIEGFDIAHLHGKFTTASLVYFRDGVPFKKEYKRFGIRSLGEGEIDDFKAVGEVVARRYSRLLNEEKPLPDLILIDGGKGQLNAALSVLKALDLKIPVIGLAKKNEEIFRPGISEPLVLPAGNPALKLLQFVRDESHRFATRHNKILRRQQLSLSRLEHIPGIGTKRSRKLLLSYGSLEKMMYDSAENLARKGGISEEAAETLIQYLSRSTSGLKPGRRDQKGNEERS